MKSRWYKDAVIYQIYPRSFCDSNGDGIGDINGIISKLDYLKDLGINAIWLSPCYKSPNDDNGYDISDYYSIMHEFGTLEDWQEMLKAMHERGIRLIMDLVVNHSSDEHEWFKKSRSSKESPYRNYYFWAKGKGKNGKKPPNNWTSKFLGSAWQYDAKTEEFYLHLFSKKQPDLNWDNPKVRQEIIDICNYWFKLGVDGFRCDVIAYIAKNSLLDSKQKFIMRGDDMFVLGDKWEQYISEINKEAWSKHDSLIVGECAGVNYEKTLQITSENKPLLDTSFTFDHMYTDAATKFKLKKLKKVYNKFQSVPNDCYTSNYLENHDQPRSLPRFAKDLSMRKTAAKMLATSFFFLRGTPYIYQGQEIGMTNCHFNEDEYKDIMSLNVLKTLKKFGKPLLKFGSKILAKKARDNARTPMQWNGEINAGFTSGSPWCKVNPNYTEINVENDLQDNDSIINYYKKLIKVRHSFIDIINNGVYKDHLPKSNNIYIFSRELEGKTLLIECNFSNIEQQIKMPKGLKFTKSLVIITNSPGDKASKLHNQTIPAYGARVYLLTN